MRKLLFICLVFFAMLKLHSQNYTYIPDVAFEQALINEGYDDVIDGRILTSSAEAVTRLEMSNQNPKITDITGIEAFTNLEYFEAIDNSIVVLDFTKNTNLQEIRCWHNSSSERTVEMLDVTGLTALTYVGLDNNLIRVADFSTNSALQIVGVQNNELTSLKFHPDANLNFLRFGDNSSITHVDISANDTNITTFRAVNNPNLTCIQVSDLTNAQTNPNWEEDNIANYSTTKCAEASFTLIPDIGFEQFLIDNAWDSGVPDGRVLTSNLNFQGRFNGFNITDPSYNINDLTGIQDFTDDFEGIDIQNQPLSITPYLGHNPNLNLIIFRNNPNLQYVSFLQYSSLTNLRLHRNNLSGIAVNVFPLLTVLQVSDNIQIKNLDVSQNTSLVEFYGYLCDFRSLDLTTNNSLEILGFDNNFNLSSLILPTTPSLTDIYLRDNQLNSLDLSNIDVNTVNTLLTCNSNITCIEVSDISLAEAKTENGCLNRDVLPAVTEGWYKDPTTTYSLDCSRPQPFTVNLILFDTDNNTLEGTEVDGADEGNSFEFGFVAQNANADLSIYQVDFNFNGSSASEGVDFTFSGGSFEDNPDPLVDGSLRINVSSDAISLENEFITVNFPQPNGNYVWLDANSDGSKSFQIPINDTSGPYQVTPTLNGAIGTSPNFEILEGQTFTLNFDSGTTVVNGVDYTPNVTIQRNGVDATADFSITGLNQPITVNNGVNPDGSIQFTANDDGNDTGDQVYTISISSENPSAYTINQNSSFTVTVKDNIASSSPFSISTALVGAGDGPYYLVEEGNEFELVFNTEQNAPSNANYNVEVTYEVFTIDSNGFRTSTSENDIIVLNGSPNNQYTYTVNTGATDGALRFVVNDDVLNEDTEELRITVNSLSNNVTISNSSIYILKIDKNDPLLIDAAIVNNNGESIARISEGGKFKLVLTYSGDSSSEFPLNLDITGSTATLDEDFTFNNSSLFNTEFETSKEIEFSVYMDTEQIENEEIIITLKEPEGNFLWNNADTNGERVFNIPIDDTPPFVVRAELSGITLNGSGEYVIGEGSDFNLNFAKVDTNLETFPDSFPITIDLSSGTAKPNEDFIEENYGGFSSRTFTIINDGIDENDEFLIIRLPKPEGPYQWENAASDGSLSFQIRITDEQFIGTKANYSFQLFERYEEDNGPFENELQGPNYRTLENRELQLRFDYDSYTPENKSVLIEIINGSAVYLEDINTSNSDINSPLVFEGSINDVVFDLSDKENGEPVENFQIRITPLSNNYNLLDTIGNPVAVGESVVLEIEIENVDSEAEDIVVTQLLNTTLKGARKIENNGNSIYQDYSVIEGDTLEIAINGLEPNSNEGNEYTLLYELEYDNAIDENDFVFSIVNTENQSILSSTSDTTGSFTFTLMNDDNDFDAKIMLEIPADDEKESASSFKLKLGADVNFRQNIQDKQVDYAWFSEANGPSKLIYNFLVNDTDSGENVFVRIKNSGGTEGESLDIITCYLEDEEGNEITNTTGQSISVSATYDDYFGPLDFAPDNPSLPRDEVAFYKNGQVVSIDNLTFSIAPNEREDHIQVEYKDEVDKTDVDCNYYYLTLQNNGGSLPSNTIIDTGRKTIKIADKSQYLIFVEVDPSNLKGVPEIFDERDATYNSPGRCKPSSEDCGEIAYYYVEENSTIKFNIDAAAPVAENNSNRYTAVLKLTDQSSGSSKVTSSDFKLEQDDSAEYPIWVRENQIDEVINVDITDDNVMDSNERFTITFNEPNNEQRYRFSKKDSENYGDAFTFVILDALEARVRENNNRRRANEENPEEEFGEILVELEAPAIINTDVYLKYSGTATFGAENDYILKSTNLQVFEEENQIVLTIPKGTQSLPIQIIPINETEELKEDEGEETVIFEIIDKFGYSKAAIDEGTITIFDDDEDENDYNVSFSENYPNQTLSENANEIQEVLLEVSINDNQTNTTGSNLEVKFDLIDGIYPPTINVDFEMYDGTDETGRKINSLDDYYITIAEGASQGTLFIKALDDGLDEDFTIESFNLSLKNGVNYVTLEPKNIDINIKNKLSDDGEINIDFGLIKAKVISASCANTDNGAVSMTNLTGIPFTVNIYKSGSDEAYKDAYELPGVQDDENFVVFDELEAGEYEIYLISNELSTQITPPSYAITVREIEENALLNEEIDIVNQLVKLTVSGSANYEVTNNGYIYQYSSENLNYAELIFPLQQGENQITIKGELECQGILKTILLNQAVTTYPNPTANHFSIAGILSQNKVEVQLFNITGKLVYQKEFEVINNSIHVDIQVLNSGVYIGKIISESRKNIDFKIIKN